MIASVLAALDDKPIAARVLALATEIAERFDAKLYLVRAITVPPEFPAAAARAVPDDPLPAHLRAVAVAELGALAAGNARASAAPRVILVGEPARAIADAADALDVDLIVIGTHLYRWPERVLGTVAAALAERGHRDVLLVREPRRGK